jgi:peptidyl-prolyl cis-trans isomerase D
MLGWTRKLLNNWLARAFFGLLVVVFVFWGISNVVTLIGSDTAIATVGGTKIDVSTVQATYQRQVSAFAAQHNGQSPSAAQRQQIANQALSQAIRDALLANEEKRLGIAVPDAEIRKAVYAIPAFQDAQGHFNQAQFTQVLAQNGFTPDAFLAELGKEQASRQLIDAVSGGAAPPTALFDRLYSFAEQQRTADMVSVPAPTTAPALPPAPVLERYWRNHPAAFTAPEYRTAQIVILSPALLATHEKVSETEIAALYAQTKDQYAQTASRSVQVITAPDQATAAKLASLWTTGASWSAMQTSASADGATAVELDNATPDQLPSPELASAVFAATPNAITGPVKGALGFYVFDVTKAVAGGDQPLAAVHDQLRDQIALQKAQADINQDLSKLQDALAGQTPLDSLPANLGLVAVEGTMDAKGNTATGQPAPIPGGAGLKSAIVNAVFAAHQGDLPQLQNGPDNAYFAVSVEKITPAALQPYDQVASKVASAWQSDQETRAAEVIAAQLLTKVKGGASLGDAARQAGLGVTATGLLNRPGMKPADTSSNVPAALLPVLFSLNPGEGTMVQTGSGFVVAQLTKVTDPKPSDDPVGSAAVLSSLTQSYQQDVADSMIDAIHDRVGFTVNQKLLASISQ